ncbi:RNA-binding protein lark [Brienomyrus brachyistius]|uniref:RNA-binding protein lark n=1 Tax=Brienomyrus brachyistius TaxID=42636 RepID=UPI0020B1FC06|nr:RNA-binding protein lark [Brienomyrus brachyistius]XP_048853750.1 RNA-binding protein lark [Brienomyrus brachyistius]XP_048853751.1 RNA-binding protein lark [Brienomyrus brachyistius]
MVKIFVGNVNSSTTEAELRALFEKYGEVSDCDILKNYGFVHMEEEDAAQKAVAALHKHELNGSRITVEYATTKVRNATKIYVGNVPEGVTAGKIKELFQRFGKVVECDIVKNFAFVHMQRENEAMEAIGELNHTKLEGQKIFVSLSRTNQPKDGRGDEFPPPPPHHPHFPPHPHHHPPYLPPRPPPGDFYAPRGRMPPPPPLPPPPPRGYYDRDVYDRSVRYDPYSGSSSRYYERDAFDRRLPHPAQRPLSPPIANRYYRERSPPGGRRALLPPPPPPPSAANYARSYPRGSSGRDFGGASLVPPPAPPSSSTSTSFQGPPNRYTVGSGFDKDDYFDDKYSNGFSRGY